MQISEQIDNLISNLQKLKPNLTSNKSENKNSFNDILERSLKLNSLDVPSDNSRNGSSNNWQDSDYNFDINKPRRPNLRELMEALSGRTVEELYKEPEEKWKDISKLASDILYGVSGNKKDSRDWYKIMSANDIITEAQSETKKGERRH